ncbi:MAG: phosphate ABC transporter permease PstA [Thermoplasmata archaeon]|nr:phosphate ABC transporter permease PstA [Thermoplasmata archaeon]
MMKFDRDFRRKLLSGGMSIAALACVLVAIIPLGSILFESLVRGSKVISLNFFVARAPVSCDPTLGCGYGGIYSAIQGTAILIAIAGAFALPVGILAGIYLSEYGRNRIGSGIRFVADVLTGVPSIVVGIVVFSLFTILTQDGYISPNYVLSVFSAGVALSFIMIPIVARTAEEALRLVPTSVREAAFALGIPRYRAVLRIVLSSARAAVVTGGLLAVARAGGETAPLIILNANKNFPFEPSLGLGQPSASLPFDIYYWIQTPYPNLQSDAWGATLVLVGIMLVLSVAARLALRNRYGGAV